MNIPDPIYRTCFNLTGTAGVFTLFTFSVGLYFAHLLFATLVGRGLYADGSFFFTALLSDDSLWPYTDDDKHIRLFVNLLNQLPISLGLVFGLDSLPTMRLMFNLGLFFVPASIYVWCAWLSYRAKDFRIFLIAFIGIVAFAMPSEIFALNQAFTAAALCWLLMHYALLNITLRRLDYVAIAVVIAVLSRSHESMLIWGVVLAFAALVGIYRKGIWTISRNNVHLYIIACGGILQVAFVAWWQFSHPVSQQTEAYLQLLSLAMPAEMWQGNTRITLLLLVMLLLLGGIYLARGRYKVCEQSSMLLWLERLVACGAVYALAHGFTLFLEPSHVNPGREFGYRFLLTFGMAAMMLLSIYIRPIAINELFIKYKYATFVVSCCFIGATTWQIANSVYWSNFQRVSIHTLAYSDKIVVSPAKVQQNLETVGLGYLYRYRWGWTWPVFGLSLHNSKNVLRVYRPEDHIEYFKLPKGENSYPYLPFVQFTQGGYFNFDLLRDACNQGACE